MSKITVGIPKALLYYKYHILWENFFNYLGCQVVVSEDTNKEIMSKGSQLSVDESCLSLKIFVGHVNYLMNKKVDYIFVPRFVALHLGEKLCVKFMALNDIVRNTFPEVNILEYTVDRPHLRFEFFGLMKIARQLGFSSIKASSAYQQARQAQLKFFNGKLQEQERAIKNLDSSQPTILIVSHPYTTYDSLLGKTIIDFLESREVNIIYSDIVDKRLAQMKSKQLSTDLYWTYNKEFIGAIEIYKRYIDGIIFLMVFPCGPDSLVVNLCQNKISDLPVAVIVLDELQGEAGLRTRLESFVDILRFKMAKQKV